MSNMSDSAYGEDYESSGSPSSSNVTMHKIQKSSSLRAPPVKKTSSEVAVIKHSKSSGKLERKVSFSEADPIKIGGSKAACNEAMTTNAASASTASSTAVEKTSVVDTNCVDENVLPAKPKRSKDKKDKTSGQHKIKAKKSDKSKVSDADFVDQVNAKLRVLERQQKAAEVVQIIDHPNSMDISATIKLSPKTDQKRPKSQQQNPAITAILQDLVSPGSETPTNSIRREKVNSSRIGSKRNSLDKQSVQTLAQDLAAECAKAYALMESSLSKLSSELGVTPFGLAPKNKVRILWQGSMSLLQFQACRLDTFCSQECTLSQWKMTCQEFASWKISLS